MSEVCEKSECLSDESQWNCDVNVVRCGSVLSREEGWCEESFQNENQKILKVVWAQWVRHWYDGISDCFLQFLSSLDMTKGKNFWLQRRGNLLHLLPFSPKRVDLLIWNSTPFFNVSDVTAKAQRRWFINSIWSIGVVKMLEPIVGWWKYNPNLKV